MKNKKIFSILLALMLLVLPVFNMADVFAEEQYTIHFELPEECGISFPDITAEKGAKVELPEIVYRETCTFDDQVLVWWNTRGVLKHKDFNTVIVPNSDVTLTGEFVKLETPTDITCSSDTWVNQGLETKCEKLNDSKYAIGLIETAHELGLMREVMFESGSADTGDLMTEEMFGPALIEIFAGSWCRNVVIKSSAAIGPYCLNYYVEYFDRTFESGKPTFTVSGGDDDAASVIAWFDQDQDIPRNVGYRASKFPNAPPDSFGQSVVFNSVVYMLPFENIEEALVAYEAKLEQEKIDDRQDEEETDEDDEEIETPSTDGEEEEIEVPKTAGDEEEISTPNTGFFALMSGASSDVLMFMIAGALCGGAFTYVRLKRW